MNMSRKWFVWCCAVVALVTVITGCSGNNGNGGNKATGQSNKGTETTDAGNGQVRENRFEKRITFSATSVDLSDDGNYMNDEIYKAFDEKFNFEYKLIPLSWDNWIERDRIWINSGDMPDMMFWNFDFKDYMNYSRQGLIKALPDDYEQKYPNLAKAMAKTGLADYLKSLDPDGRIYIVPNVIYYTPVTETTDLVLDSKVLYYRKDWADKVGIKVGATITAEQLAELGKAFVKQDPGGNGAGRTVGLSSSPYQLYSAFIQTHNSFYNQFYKGKDGKYIWGGTEDSTLEGIKSFAEYFKQGFIDKDYYTFKGKEHYDKFNTGISGMFIDGASAANVNERYQAFSKANPGVNPEEAIGLATVVDPDGKYHGQQNLLNYWAGELFNPKLDDETFDRILSILDHIASPEGQRLIYAGVEGKDYKMEGDKLVVTREKDEQGNFKYIGDLYPSYYFFYTKVVLPDNWSAQDPSLPDNVRKAAIDMFRMKEKITDLVPPDYDVMFLSAPNKDKFNVVIDDAISQMILENKSIETSWTEWKKSIEGKVNAVLGEINGALAK
ncbi:extracellular solute-binding protein [Paenibacillus sp. GCM10027626]|uniref:extracellular solute-binding protein n=1 Tax=Paenibacillus sp. GCM10027626 TaxID=3273411 RepID=UPI0036337A87